MRWVLAGLLVALLTPILYVAAGHGAPPGVLVGIAVVIAAAAIGSLLEYRRRLNPFAVYAMIVVTVAGAAGLVWLLSWLDPVALLLMTIALGMITLVMSYRRGDQLRRERALSGLCEACGYDLRSSVDVCPECGSPLPEELLRRRRIAEMLAAEQEARASEARAKLLGR